MSRGIYHTAPKFYKENLDIRDGQILVKGEEGKSLSCKEVLSRAPSPIIGRGTARPPVNTATHGFGEIPINIQADAR